MNMLDQLNAKIAEFGLEGIRQCETYVLKNKTWSEDEWPCSQEPGIYAIFSEEELLYIGKSSNEMGHRLSTYFKKSDSNGFETHEDHTWASPPNHVITWAVPQKFANNPLEELEAFLISALNPSGNTQNRSDSQPFQAKQTIIKTEGCEFNSLFLYELGAMVSHTSYGQASAYNIPML